jgi:hypothetical protein
MVEALNFISGNYINTTFANSDTSARSVGTERGSNSLSTGPTANYTPDSNQSGWSTAALNNLNGMRAGEEFPETDINALSAASIRLLGNGYWLGARKAVSGVNGVSFLRTLCIYVRGHC